MPGSLEGSGVTTGHRTQPLSQSLLNSMLLTTPRVSLSESVLTSGSP